jgi:hypothetical protein
LICATTTAAAAEAGAIDWLMQPIDAARPHRVGDETAWHARLMVLAWAVVLPLGVLAARFFKVMPRQDWPRMLDNKAWWRFHTTSQYLGGALILVGLGLALMIPASGAAMAFWHHWFGWIALALAAVQFGGGWLRGSKGGPTAPAADGSLRGDHYDMTTRRRVFEHVHKSVGYIALAVASTAILLGLLVANAPRWMWIAIPAWWLAIVVVFVVLQRRRLAIDTYQAIWGPDPAHPGNRLSPIGFGVHRPAAGGSPSRLVTDD